MIDAPGLKREHYDVFDCAMGERAIKPMGHVRMMAACQPFLSGAISKTVNLPETATVDEIGDVYFQAPSLITMPSKLYWFSLLRSGRCCRLKLSRLRSSVALGISFTSDSDSDHRDL